MADANELGREAYLSGDDMSLNPYDGSDAQHDEWYNGYWQEKFNDSEKAITWSCQLKVILTNTHNVAN